MRLTKRFLLIAFIAILTLCIAITIYNSFAANRSIPVEIVKEEVDSDKYIISEQMITSKLTAKSQIVSLQQDFSKRYTDVDDSWLGKRKTEFSVSGIYKIGLEMNNIKVQGIDSDKGIIHIELPDPVLISLEIPYDEISIHKEQGLFRSNMNEEEKKNFYKIIVKDIRKQLKEDKQIQKQANLYNQDAVRELLTDLAGVQYVVFE